MVGQSTGARRALTGRARLTPAGAGATAQTPSRQSSSGRQAGQPISREKTGFINNPCSSPIPKERPRTGAKEGDGRAKRLSPFVRAWPGRQTSAARPPCRMGFFDGF